MFSNPTLQGYSTHGTCIIRWYLRIRCANIKKDRVFFENNFKFATTVDLNKCLIQIKLPNSLYISTSISVLPSDIITMVGREIVHLKGLISEKLNWEAET